MPPIVKKSNLTTTLYLTRKQKLFIKSMLLELKRYQQTISYDNKDLRENNFLFPEYFLSKIVCGLGKLPPIIPKLYFSSYFYTIGNGIHHTMNDYELFLYKIDIDIIISMLYGVLNSSRNNIFYIFNKITATVIDLIPNLHKV